MFNKLYRWENLKDKALAKKLRNYRYNNSDNGEEYVDYDGNIYLTKDGAQMPFVVVHEGRHREKALNGDLLHNKTLNQINDKLSDVAPALAFMNGFNGGKSSKTVLHRIQLATPRTIREGIVNYESRKILPKEFHGDSYTSDASYAVKTLDEIKDDLRRYNQGKALRGLLIKKI